MAAGSAILLALVTAISGTQWLPLAGAAFGVGTLLAALAGLLIWLRMKMGSPTGRWTLLTVLTEASLLPAGVGLVTPATAVNQQAGTPQSPGTDGPFADGLVGVIGMMGYAYVVGAALVIGLIGWAQATL